LPLIPSGTDLVILPELFTTGFTMNAASNSEAPFSETFQWMARISAEYCFAMCGSYIVEENSLFFNRWVFVTPENSWWSYDKRHLFGPGGEDKIFTRGSERLVLGYSGVRISASVCYDLRFPVWIRNRNEYDLLINSANWPESRRDVWITLLKARAIENQCYVAGVNRVGTDGKGIKYCGDSVIINPRGEITAMAGKNKECLVTGEISMAELSDFRLQFPAGKDADNFTLHP